MLRRWRLTYAAIACWLFGGLGAVGGGFQVLAETPYGTLTPAQKMDLVYRGVVGPAIVALGVYWWRRRRAPLPEYVGGAKGFLWDLLGFVLTAAAIVSGLFVVSVVGAPIAGLPVYPLRAAAWVAGFVLSVLGARYFRAKRLLKVP